MRRKLVLTGALFSLVSICAGLHAASPKPAPWLWTIEDRIEQRTDPAARATRLARERPSVREVRRGFSPINGAIEPELFLPFELMRTFVRFTVHEAPRSRERRESFRGVVTTAGWDFDRFWEVVDRSSSPYNELYRQSAELQERSFGQADIGPLSPQLCAAQAHMLRVVYREFGETEFNRFLYTNIAPGSIMWTDDRIDITENLEKSHGGCQ